MTGSYFRVWNAVALAIGLCAVAQAQSVTENNIGKLLKFAEPDTLPWLMVTGLRSLQALLYQAGPLPLMV